MLTVIRYVIKYGDKYVSRHVHNLRSGFYLSDNLHNAILFDLEEFAWTSLNLIYPNHDELGKFRIVSIEYIKESRIDNEED